MCNQIMFILVILKYFIYKLLESFVILICYVKGRAGIKVLSTAILKRREITLKDIVFGLT